jgi:hypothetical protein
MSCDGDVRLMAQAGASIAFDIKNQTKTLVNILINICFCLILSSIHDYTKVQFRSRKFCKKTVDSPSHRIFGRMHEALNIDKK